MQAPRIEKITLNMGVGEAKQDSKMLEAAAEQLGHDRRPEAEHPPRPQVDRAVQGARGDARRPGRDAAPRARLRVPRPPDVDRDPADPRLPRPERRAPSTAAATTPWASASRSSSPRSTTTPSTRSAAWTSTITTSAADRRGGLRAARGARHAVQPRGQPLRVDRRDRGARLMAKTSQRVRQARPAKYKTREYTRCRRCGRVARRLPQVRRVPDLPARARAQRLHPRHDEEQLVGAFEPCP